MPAWSIRERATAYLSIEGGLALGFIMPLVVSISWGDVIAVMFFPMTTLFAWFTFFASVEGSPYSDKHTKAGRLAITLFIAAVPSFVCALFGSMHGLILSWLPIVLMSLTRLTYRSLINRLEQTLIGRIRKGGIVLFVSVFILAWGMMFGMDGKWYIHESWSEETSIFLTGTQLFLLTMIVSSSFFILDLIFGGEILDLVKSYLERT